MLYMIGDKIVEITKTGSYRWNEVGTPDISQLPTVEEFLISTELSDPHRMFESFVDLVDTNYYHLMSQNESTEFIYRFFSNLGTANIDGVARLFGQ